MKSNNEYSVLRKWVTKKKVKTRAEGEPDQEAEDSLPVLPPPKGEEDSLNSWNR